MQAKELETLLRTCPPAAQLRLADWYAQPLSAEAARALLAQARRRRQATLKAGEPTFTVRLIELIAGWWAGQDLTMHHDSLAAESRTAHERALLELATGQLLISRKLAAGRAHLQRGFALAAPLLPAQDYFTVMKRHGLLEYLPLSPVPAAPAGLEALLTEAAVIQRLEGNRSRSGRADPQDTLG
jgi:hypothetical protein